MTKAAICITGTNPTVRFAGRELARYLKLATGKATATVRSPDAKGVAVFHLGVCDELGVPRPAGLGPDDDWMHIRPQGSGYVLTGSNPRSVLFAVYRYLHALGFRWLRPGQRGEVVPNLKSPLKKGVRVNETASYRYRTFCIEGAASKEHVRDLIDWSAKQLMNGYFIQFEYGLYFFQRWYDHEANPYMKKEPIDLAKGQAIVEDLVAEIKRRGLRFEQVGHGWTCAALGLPGEGWGKIEPTLTDAQRAWLAQLNGQRQLFGGVPLNTNLCYGNPAVRTAVADKIAAYAAAHPEVDAIHFWLADGSNNNCECELCQKARPADFYVDMLNELDAKLTAAGLKTRIVFLIYVDLLWPPVRSRFNNPDRFILMFAPITRSYLSNFADAAREREPMTDYVRNKLQFPKGAGANLGYLRAWQALFKGDGFDFDYHIIWPCYYELNHFTLGRTLHKDIQKLGQIGLHGFNSCQNQRSSYPTNLLMDILARTLWDKRASFTGIVASTFADAYGRDGAKVAALCEKVSGLWKPFFEDVYLPVRDEARIEQGLKNLPKIAAAVAEAKALVKKNIKQTRGAVQWSWKYLDSYLKLLDLWLPALEAYLSCSAETPARFDAVFDFLWRNEKTLHPALDVDTFIKVLQWRVNQAKAERQKQ